MTYTWTLTAKPVGSAATLSSATSAKPSFSADVAGTYTASVVVNDGKVNSNAATVSVTAAAANVAPTANAGRAQNVVTGTAVTLDGSASSDANGDPLTYAWTLTGKPVGSAAALSSSSAAKPTFTADAAGTYVASLLVNDGKISSSGTTVSITAAAANAAPVANAGGPRSVAAGSLVTLDGSASSDANSDPLTYAWSLTSKPAGSTAVLSSATVVKPTFTADITGTYVASLLAHDGKTASTAATVAITATQAPSLTLLTVPDSFFGGTASVIPWPYSTNAAASASINCVGTSCKTVYDIASFQLRTTGKNFTVTGLKATNTTPGSTIAPLFSGLTNGQIIANGQTATFTLQSPFTRGATVNLNYSFTVQETGATFNHSVQLRTD